MKRLCGLTVAGMLGCVLLMSPVAKGDVLEQVPSDALAVVKINNLEEVSGKIGNLARQWGLADFVPEMGDPLSSFLEEEGMEAGLNRGGDMAIVFLDPDEVGEAGADIGEAVVVLVPVTDYQAFIGNFEDAETENGVTQLRADHAFAAQWGDYAAISETRSLVERPGNGFTVEGVAAEQLAENDATVLVNFEAVRPKLLPLIQENREEFLAMMEMEMRQDGEERFIPVMRTVANQVMDFAEAFVEQAQSATYGVRVTDAGISTTAMAEFESETNLANAVSRIRNSDESMLEGLPEGTYLLYGGSVQDPEAMAELIDQIAEPLLEHLRELGDEATAVVEYVEALRSFQSAQTGGAFAMVAPTGMLGQAPLFQTIAVVRGDADEMSAAQVQMFQTQQDMMQMLDPDGVQTETTFTANEREVAGVRFDRFRTEIQFDPQSPEQAQAAQMMMFMYGGEAISAYSGRVDDQTLILVSGLSDEAIERVVTAVRDGADPISAHAGVRETAAELPSDRAAVVYVPVGDIVRTSMNYAAQFGFPMQVEIPADLAPIGVTIGSEGRAIRVDSHVPSELVEAMVSVGLQIMMGMGGGMGPGAF